MNPERHERISDLFNQACELRTEDREAFLDRACRGDDELRSEVVALLMSYKDSSAGDTADSGEAGTAPSSDRPSTDRFARRLRAGAGAIGGDTVPGTIGPFEIRGVLGRGGMGVVYHGHQRLPDREVAIKVMGARLFNAAANRRFLLEIDALGRLQHDGIARLYEAGAIETDAGDQPYFVMEHLEGEDLIRHANSHDLGIDDRIDLLCRVCDAVQHAHANGVLHRDLKPANVLVTRNGQPKVLDFGVARVSTRDGEDSDLTQPGELLGTVAYMSPEQARGDVHIDARSDVYSLGVMLYELLSGQLPNRVRGRPITEALSAVCTEMPLPLSRRDRRLRGDVETIAAKALEKTAGLRYASPAEFAEDLRRHLRDESILARPPGVGQQLARIARRHRALATAIALTLVGLIAASVISFTYWQRAVDEREVALRERDRSHQLLDFVTHILDAANSERFPGRDVTVRELLDQAAREMEATPPTDPEIALGIHRILGQTYTSLVLLEEASRHLERAESLLIQVGGQDREEYGEVLRFLAEVSRHSGKVEEARRRFEALDRFALQDPAACSWASAASLLGLAEIEREWGDPRETLRMLEGLDPEVSVGQGRRAVEIRRLMLRCRGRARRMMGDAAGAVQDFQNALAFSDRSAGLYSGASSTDVSELGLALVHAGEVEEGTLALRRALAIQDRLLGEEHPYTLFSLASFSRVLAIAGAPIPESFVVRIDRLVADRTVENQTLLGSRAWFDAGCALVALGRPKDAIDLFEASLEVDATRPHPDFPGEANAATWIGRLHRDLGDLEAAEPWLRRAASSNTSFDPNAGVFLAGVLLGLDRRAEAVTAATNAELRCERLLGKDHPKTVVARDLVEELTMDAATQAGEGPN